MLSSDAFNVELAPEKDWRTAYPFVEAEARKFLDTLAEGMTLSTTALVDGIYTGAIIPQIRSRVFKALRASADRGLQRYVTKGEPEKVGHVENARRLHWHRGKVEGIPPAKSCCPECGRPF